MENDEKNKKLSKTETPEPQSFGEAVNKRADIVRFIIIGIGVILLVVGIIMLIVTKRS